MPSLAARAAAPKALAAKKATRVRAAAAAQAKAFAASPTRKPKRVLVAENQSRISEITAARLKRLGLIVRRWRDPARLALAMDVFKPDLLILDEHFDPRGAFGTSIASAKGRHPLTKVLVTVDADEATLAPGQRPTTWGANAVIEKGTMFKNSGLENAVEKALNLGI